MWQELMKNPFAQGLFIGLISGFITGFITNIIILRFTPAWEPFKERFSEFIKQHFRRFKREEKRFTIGTVVLNGVEEARLQPVRIGNMLLPMRILIGGDGETRYKFPDGIICAWNREKLVLPEDMAEAYPRFLEKRREAALERGAVFEQRDHVRLDDYKIRLVGIEDAPSKLELTVSLTDYYTIQATNYSIDEILPGGSTIRKKYATDPSNLRNSVLANPLAVNLSVVTADRQIYISLRGKKTAVTASGFAPAVSGTGNPLTDIDNQGIYSPFLTAQREAEEEIIGYRPDLSEITFFGLARTLKYQLPFLFGEVRLSRVSAGELESSFPRDLWESEGLYPLPLEVDAIVEFIKKIYKEMEEKIIIGSATYAALFSLLQSLRYEYPESWKKVVEELSELEKK
jgi:hypothetical protein